MNQLYACVMKARPVGHPARAVGWLLLIVFGFSLVVALFCPFLFAIDSLDNSTHTASVLKTASGWLVFLYYALIIIVPVYLTYKAERRQIHLYIPSDTWVFIPWMAIGTIAAAFALAADQLVPSGLNMRLFCSAATLVACPILLMYAIAVVIKASRLPEQSTPAANSPATSAEENKPLLVVANSKYPILPAAGVTPV